MTIRQVEHAERLGSAGASSTQFLEWLQETEVTPDSATGKRLFLAFADAQAERANRLCARDFM